MYVGSHPLCGFDSLRTKFENKLGYGEDDSSGFIVEAAKVTFHAGDSIVTGMRQALQASRLVALDNPWAGS
jgi:hypothetical protein